MTDQTTATEPLHIGVLLFEDVEPLDAVGPAQVFWSLGSARRYIEPFRATEVHLVAETTDPVRFGHGMVVHPAYDYDTAPALDVLIVPGGSGAEREVDDGPGTFGRRFQAQHEPTLAFVRRQAAHAEVVASVCTGAGLLDGHRGNTHWSARDELVRTMEDRGESFVLEVARVVDDGAIVTAGGVSSGIDLGLHLVERFLGPEPRRAAAAIIEQETPGPA
jgi:transcriptional regulator GlxA family with amidase domain